MPALKDSNGIWKESREDIGALQIEDFTRLYRAKEIRRSESLDEFIPCCVSREENVNLEAIPTECEIWNVVKNMHPIKVPGPYGMLARFFQIIGE